MKDHKIYVAKALGNKCNRCYKVSEGGQRIFKDQWVCEFCAKLVQESFPDVWHQGMAELAEALREFDEKHAAKSG